MDTASEAILPVIMCGGSGSRLWPASRESMPKQFIQLIGERSTFQTTAERVSNRGDFQRPIVLTNSDSRFVVAEQLAAEGIAAEIVLEPTRRDSAAAVAVAACLAEQRDPSTVVLILAADHVVPDADAFVAACKAAAHGARAGLIMTLGIEPSYAATGYGYICRGEPIPDCNAFRVERFVEKPDAASADRYVENGYLWNSGYFVFRADVMVREFEKHAPEVLQAARAALAGASVDLDFIRLEATAYGSAPKISIDYAIMEKTDASGVLPVSFPWSDIGTWDALWDASAKDASGNVVRGRAEVLNSSNSLVHSEEVLTTLVGLENVVVVSTPDAVLVSSRSGSGEVKELVALLQSKHYTEADEHVRMYRPWGWYQRLDLAERFQVKRIMVKPGGRLSLQRHYHRSEHWIVVRGSAEVTSGEKTWALHENESIYIPIGTVHRLANPGRIPLELIEVQTGSYLGEDDIVRVEDIYGRGP